MPYITAAEVRSFAPLVVGSWTDAQMNSYFISQAENRINAGLAQRYTTPISPTPLMVAEIARDYTIKLLLEKAVTHEGMNENQWLTMWVSRTDSLLAQLSRGEIALISSSGTIIEPARDDVWSNVKDFTPTFTVLDPLDQELDPDRTKDD